MLHTKYILLYEFGPAVQDNLLKVPIIVRSLLMGTSRRVK